MGNGSLGAIQQLRGQNLTQIPMDANTSKYFTIILWE